MMNIQEANVNDDWTYDEGAGRIAKLKAQDHFEAIDVTVPPAPTLPAAGAPVARCGDCRAFHRTGPAQGECRLAPPTVLFMGFQQPPSAALQIKAMPPQPIVAATFPTVNQSAWCCCFSPAEVN